MENEKFFDKRNAVPLAEKLPSVRDAVTAYGFQTGGVGLSTTKGIVSRIEYGRYNYGQAGLRMEITAQLREGNSGGPAISGGKIVGLVFAVSTRGNIGHAIPAEEITEFLKAPADTRDFEKLTLRLPLHRLENEALREKRGIPNDVTGVLVGDGSKAIPISPLKAGDILTKIGKYEIDNTGMVHIFDTRLGLFYLVHKLAKDGKVPLTVLRDGKEIAVSMPVRTNSREKLIPTLKLRQPSYFVWGPLAFSPATSELVGSLGQFRTATWISGRSPVLTRAGGLVRFPGEELVMVVAMFPHKLVKGYSSPVGLTVEKVNGIRIRNLKHLVETLRDVKDPFVEFKFAERFSANMVFKRKQVQAAMEQILTDNGIRLQASPRSLLRAWEK